MQRRGSVERTIAHVTEVVRAGCADRLIDLQRSPVITIGCRDGCGIAGANSAAGQLGLGSDRG